MAKRKITQLDLFSGIGGFHLGFERAGYEVKSYFSEIDKHAVAVYKQQFKDSTYVGSVTDVRGAELPKIDLITFGSPCQDFSLAGKRKGLSGDRSSLVLEAIRLINECRPSVFIWENVKGTFSSNAGADFYAIIQAFTNIGGYRLEWQLLNTSWVLPQNRERVYLVGYSTTPGGDWRGVFPIGEKFRGFNERTRKATNVRSLVAGAKSGGRHSTMTLLKVKSATAKGYEVATEGDSINLSQPNSETRRGRVGKGKAQTLDTAANQAVVQAGRITGRNPDNPKSRESGLLTKQMLEINENPNKTNCISTVQKDNVVVEPKYEIGDWRKDTGYRPRNNGLSPTLRSSTETNKPILTTPQYRIRRLTPIECERLQGFPDNHTEYGNYDGEVKKMSNTQRYKQCGNAVTVDIVALVAEAVKPLFK
jgi:DNA (cytosine-5)-methyltransferase 1